MFSSPPSASGTSAGGLCGAWCSGGRLLPGVVGGLGSGALSRQEVLDGGYLALVTRMGGVGANLAGSLIFLTCFWEHASFPKMGVSLFFEGTFGFFGAFSGEAIGKTTFFFFSGGEVPTKRDTHWSTNTLSFVHRAKFPTHKGVSSVSQLGTNGDAPSWFLQTI